MRFWIETGQIDFMRSFGYDARDRTSFIVRRQSPRDGRFCRQNGHERYSGITAVSRDVFIVNKR